MRLKVQGVPAQLMRFNEEYHGTSSAVQRDAHDGLHDGLVQPVDRGRRYCRTSEDAVAGGPRSRAASHLEAGRPK